MITRLRQVRQARGERGASLVEGVVTVLLMSIVLGLTFSAFVSYERGSAGSDDRTRNLNEGRVLMGVVTKDVRTAVRLTANSSPFVLANKREITFYANLSTTGAPKKVHIYVDSQSRLIEEIWNPDPGSVAPNYTYTGTSTVRFVGRYVANPSTQPIFVYLNDSGVPLTNTPLNSTDKLAVKAVKIVLELQKVSSVNAPKTTLVNRVRLPNLDYNAVAG